MATGEPLDLSTELDSLLGALPDWGREIGATLDHVFGAAPVTWISTLVAMAVAGFVAEWLACRKVKAVNERMQRDHTGKWYVALGYAAFQVLFAFGGIALSALVAWVVMGLGLEADTPIYEALLQLLIAVVVFRSCVALAGIVFAPQAEGIRLVRLSTPDAGVLFRWTVAVAGVYVLVVYASDVLALGAMTPLFERASVTVLGALLVATILVFVWTNRGLIARLFTDKERRSDESSILADTLADSWPYLVTAWLVILWLAWAHATMTADVERADSVRVSWWITITFPLIDRLLHAALRKFVNLPMLQSSSFSERSARFVTVVQTGVRLVLLVTAVVALAVTWQFAGADRFFEQWGERLVDLAINVGGTLLIAYVLYELVMSYLERKMPKGERDPAHMGGEAGGVGKTREETLAPLLRSVFLFLLAVVVVLAVLHSLGVQILPLLAGAGILGLAIGFGSQKLVQDIISGIFFLIDDAFRVGEYVVVGDAKGVVEKISIRSFQLRHHNGPLSTIPFGEVRHLTNFSRDWAIMKLNLRVSYDTDVDRVRKLIKQLGQEMLEDEELGPLFLQPLKSQGVYSMEDDSAIIIRVKFMTRPGDQFILRRAVYARLQDLFEREGIEVPHKVVTVKVDDSSEPMDPQRKRQAAAAAIAGEE